MMPSNRAVPGSVGAGSKAGGTGVYGGAIVRRSATPVPAASP